jgi:hypothetical protein
MVIVTNNWRMWLIGTGVSLAIFLVLFFTVIKPSSDNANTALKQGLQQSQQAINQAQQQVKAAGGAGSSVASQQLGNAAKLTACVSAAGTDVSKLQTCQTQYGH